MRTFILTIALTLAFGTLSAMVPEPESANVKAKQVVKNAMVYPEFAIEQGIEGVVYMQLQVDDQGRIEVVKANSCCNELLRYAVDKIEGMKVEEGKYEPGKPFNMKFQFILL